MGFKHAFFELNIVFEGFRARFEVEADVPAPTRPGMGDNQWLQQVLASTSDRIRWANGHHGVCWERDMDLERFSQDFPPLSHMAPLKTDVVKRFWEFMRSVSRREGSEQESVTMVDHINARLSSGGGPGSQEATVGRGLQHYLPEKGDLMGLFFALLLENLPLDDIKMVRSKNGWQRPHTTERVVFHRRYAKDWAHHVEMNSPLRTWHSMAIQFLDKKVPEGKKNHFKWIGFSLTRKQIVDIATNATYQFAKARGLISMWSAAE